jgi:hypothetical protein
MRARVVDTIARLPNPATVPRNAFVVVRSINKMFITLDNLTWTAIT